MPEELENTVTKLENTVEKLKGQVNSLTEVIKTLIPTNINNKDGIPIGMQLFGHVKNIGTIVMETEPKGYTVKKIGIQQISNGKQFNSLSAAAEAFSMIKRQSGWIFWRNSSGKTLKDVFKG